MKNDINCLLVATKTWSLVSGEKEQRGGGNRCSTSTKRRWRPVLWQKSRRLAQLINIKYRITFSDYRWDLCQIGLTISWCFHRKYQCLSIVIRTFNCNQQKLKVAINDFRRGLYSKFEHWIFKPRRSTIDMFIL